jgi:hypothetical protein
LGSTGKKPAGQTCGDIDMAIDAAKVGANFKLKFDEVQPYIYDKLKSKFKNVVNMKGLGIISFLYPIPNSDGKFGQVDVMLVDNVDLASFVFHSPDFTKNESKYKGIYRSMLLMLVIKYMDVNDEVEYFDDGDLKTFTKYSITAKKGLFKQLKTYQGKIGKVKNPRAVKGSDQPITQVPSEIVKLVFGDKYDVSDMNSFESIYKIVTSSDFKHKKHANKIIKAFKDDIIKKGLPLPSEIK